jgi:hypothetical protein
MYFIYAFSHQHDMHMTEESILNICNMLELR